MLRRSLVPLTVAAIAIGGCGTDSTPSGGDLSEAASKASAQARALAKRTRALQEEVATTARRLVQEPATRDAAQKTLEDQADRARELVDEAEQLPAEDSAREDLIAANERTAEAAGDLQRYAESNQEEALEEARKALDVGREQLSEASDNLLDTAPASARKALEDARKELPDIPSPSDLR